VGSSKKKRLGDLLRERGRISHQDLDRAIQEQQGKVTLLGELLLERGLLAKEDLIDALQEITSVRYEDCQSAASGADVLALLPRSVAARNCVLPLSVEGKKLTVVMAEPQNLSAIDELRFISGMEISPRLGFRAEIMAAIERCYAQNAAALREAEEELVEAEEKFLEIADESTADIEFFTSVTNESNQDALREFAAEMRKERTPAVRLVSAIIAAAVAKKASDIHIDPQARGTMIRLRVDGILRDLMQVPQHMQASLTSRVKILSDMDIAERRAPQDGRILVRIKSGKIDLRVSTLPTHYGEKIVLRLLDPHATQVGFLELGLSGEQLKTITTTLAKPQGMLLVTGPTGSGKTTTLYAALNALRTRAVNIITVEDPVEYMLEGINQVQVNVKGGRSFASCLRSILRQDPNVIMVGEIRDAETAEIALTAAQTGHFVLSTLHTNDSVAAIVRMLDLGVPAFLIASSVSAIIAQRLVRRLCTCRRELDMTPENRARLFAAGVTDLKSTLFAPAGCPECDGMGYRGRVGIYENFIIDKEVSEAIRTGAKPDEIRSLARHSGLKLLQEEALEKVWAGITTLEEVLRVIPFESTAAARCQECNQRLAPGFLLCPYCGTPRRGTGRETERHTALQPVIRGEREK
jgi:type IV pilus assembly protein PilB